MLLEFLISKSKFDFFSFFFQKSRCNDSKKIQPKLKFQPKSAWNNKFQQNFDPDTKSEKQLKIAMNIYPSNFHALYMKFNRLLEEESKFICLKQKT